MSTIKRFIAGAVCPRCGELDKLTMYTSDAGEQVRECVRCDYSDRMTEDGPVDELGTRVNTPRVGEQTLAHEVEVSLVKILDPAKKPG